MTSQTSPSDTSGQVFHKISNGRKKNLQDAIVAICALWQRKGVQDFGATELSLLLEAQALSDTGHTVRINSSSLSGPISGLVAAGRLVKREGKRPCTHTRQDIQAYFVPATQARLVA